MIAARIVQTEEQGAIVVVDRFQEVKPIDT